MNGNIYSKLFYLFLLTFGLTGSLINCENKFIRAGQICKTEADCVNNPNCKCYCAFKPGYRKKTAKDTAPIYLNAEQDPYGKRCYCDQRDLDKLASRLSRAPKSHMKRILID